MSLFVERKEPTVYGEIAITITRTDHMSVQGQPEVRLTKFNCHLHFYRQPDNTWAVRREDYPSMTRAWVGNANRYRESAPPSYFKKVLAEYTAVINKFAAANPNIFVEAETSDIERDIETATAKVEKAQAALLDAVAVLDALNLKRRDHLVAQLEPGKKVAA